MNFAKPTRRIYRIELTEDVANGKSSQWVVFMGISQAFIWIFYNFFPRNDMVL